MLKFFRRNRRQLLVENKFSKYLLYAVGEIILVVIGILIALEINNSNELRKQNKTLKAIFSIIKDDLSSDLVDINEFIEDYEQVRKPIFDTLLYAKPKMEDLIKNPGYTLVLMGYQDLDINTRGYNLLMNQSTIVQINSTLTSEISAFYNDHLVEIETAQSELADDFDNNKKILNSVDWMPDFFIDGETEGYYNFILNEPEARRRIISYSIVYKIYVSELVSFREDATKLIMEIENAIAEK